MHPARRRLLQGAIAMGLAPVLRTAAAQPVAPGFQTVQNLLAGWDELGWEWTGTQTERNSADWLARLTSAAGLDVAIERYPFERVDVAQCTVEVGAQHAAGLPLFDGGATDSQGIAGRLTAFGSDGDIAVLEMAPWNSHGSRLAKARIDPRYRAVIVITRGAGEGLAPLDAASPLASRPQPRPVVQIGSEHRSWLLAGAASNAQATVTARFERAPGEGRNVVSVWTGTDRSLPPLVVLAGRSGWGPCVAERGGGLVCVVHAAQALVQAVPPRTVIFAATSGCELGNMGQAAFMQRYPKLGDQAQGWIELGPNLGTRNVPLEISGARQAWLDLLKSRLNIEQARWREGHLDPGDLPGGPNDEDDATSASDPGGHPGTSSAPEATAPRGTRAADLAPSRALLLQAPAGPAYHLPGDLLPKVIDLGQTLAVSKAFVSTLLELAQA